MDYNSCPEMFCKIFALKNAKNVQENSCTGVFFNKVLGCRLGKNLRQRCFPVNVAKLLRTVLLVKLGFSEILHSAKFY